MHFHYFDPIEKNANSSREQLMSDENHGMKVRLSAWNISFVMWNLLDANLLNAG